MTTTSTQAVTTLPDGAIGLDYSGFRPDATKMHAVGVQFVCRYLCDPITHLDKAKQFHASELQQLWTSDFKIGVLLNWENSERDYASGHGKTYGAHAAEQASAVGYPTQLPIIVSVDTEVAPGELGTVKSYFEDFKSGAGGYPLGVYGQKSVADALTGLVDFVWGPGSWGFSPKGWKPHDILQMQPHGDHYSSIVNDFGVGNVDVNVAQRAISVWTGPS